MKSKLKTKYDNRETITICFDVDTLLNKSNYKIKTSLIQLKQYHVNLIASTFEENIDKIKSLLMNAEVPFDLVTNKRVEYDIFLDQNSGLSITSESINDLLFHIEYQIKLNEWTQKWKCHIKKHRLELNFIENINVDLLLSFCIYSVSIWGSGDIKVPTLYFKYGKTKYELKSKGTIHGWQQQRRITNSYLLTNTKKNIVIFEAVDGTPLFEVLHSFPWDELGDFYK
jgi:hypothetical protein